MSEKQASYETSTSDPATYRRLSVPFATEAAAEEALGNFIDIVKAARRTCELPDVHVLIRENHIDSEGVEQVGLSALHLGSSEAALNMLGYAYAEALEPHRAFVSHANAKMETRSMAKQVLNSIWDDGTAETDGAGRAVNIHEACLNRSHDYGLMKDAERQAIINEAKEWARAFGLPVEK